MSDFTDVIHEALVGAVKPFVGSIGADLLGSALEVVGAVVSGSDSDSDAAGRSN